MALKKTVTVHGVLVPDNTVHFSHSVPRFPPGVMLTYHVIGCVRARVLVTYIIRTDPGTYPHSEPNCCAKIIEQVPNRGWNSTTLKWKKEPLPIPARGWNPTTPQREKDSNSGGHTHNNLSQNLYQLLVILF